MPYLHRHGDADFLRVVRSEEHRLRSPRIRQGRTDQTFRTDLLGQDAARIYPKWPGALSLERGLFLSRSSSEAAQPMTHPATQASLQDLLPFRAVLAVVIIVIFAMIAWPVDRARCLGCNCRSCAAGRNRPNYCCRWRHAQRR